MKILGKWASSARDCAFSQAEEFWVQAMVPTWWQEKTDGSTLSSDVHTCIVHVQQQVHTYTQRQ